MQGCSNASSVALDKLEQGFSLMPDAVVREYNGVVSGLPRLSGNGHHLEVHKREYGLGGQLQAIQMILQFFKVPFQQGLNFRPFVMGSGGRKRQLLRRGLILPGFPDSRKHLGSYPVREGVGLGLVRAEGELVDGGFGDDPKWLTSWKVVEFHQPLPLDGYCLERGSAPGDIESLAYIGGRKPDTGIVDCCPDGLGLERENRGSRRTFHNASVRTFQVHEDNLPNEDCRALKTANGAADYFPEGVVFRPRPARMTIFYPGIRAKEKANLSGGAAAVTCFQHAIKRNHKTKEKSRMVDVARLIPEAVLFKIVKPRRQLCSYRFVFKRKFAVIRALINAGLNGVSLELLFKTAWKVMRIPPIMLYEAAGKHDHSFTQPIFFNKKTFVAILDNPTFPEAVGSQVRNAKREHKTFKPFYCLRGKTGNSLNEKMTGFPFEGDIQDLVSDSDGARCFLKKPANDIVLFKQAVAVVEKVSYLCPLRRLWGYEGNSHKNPFASSPLDYFRRQYFRIHSVLSSIGCSIYSISNPCLGR